MFTYRPSPTLPIVTSSGGGEAAAGLAAASAGLNAAGAVLTLLGNMNFSAPSAAPYEPQQTNWEAPPPEPPTAAPAPALSDGGLLTPFKALGDSLGALGGGNRTAVASTTAAPPSQGLVKCSPEVQKNIDWVFRDAGARATYRSLTAQGLSPFDAGVGAQAHNPRVQALLTACRPTAEAYLAQKRIVPHGPTLSDRPLTPQDCSCISVLPTGGPGALFNVTNSCSAMAVTVAFTDTLNSSKLQTASAGIVSPGARASCCGAVARHSVDQCGDAEDGAFIAELQLLRL